MPGFEVRDHPSLRAALRAILPRRTYLLDIDGAPMRTALEADDDDDDDGCSVVGFVAGDDAGLGRGEHSALMEMGATPVGLGPKMLLASHCVVLAHAAMDEREAARGRS